MEAQRLGIVERTPTPFGLAQAARLIAGASAVDLHPSEPDPGVDTIVVDAAPGEREALLASIGATGTPIITEMPGALSADGVERLESALSGSPVVSINPLAHHMHTKRLLDLVRDESDPVTAIFAAWRFRPGDFQPAAPAQLLDYVASISTEPPVRIAGMRRESPDIVVATIRFEDGIVAHIEYGAHLPPSFGEPSELTIEIFRRESVLHADAFGQSLAVYGKEYRAVQWAPSAASIALQDSLDAIASDAAPRGLAGDHAALTMIEAVEWSARRRSVARL